MISEEHLEAIENCRDPFRLYEPSLPGHVAIDHDTARELVRGYRSALHWKAEAEKAQREADQAKQTITNLLGQISDLESPR